jgi:hypothetical protein
MLLRHVAFLARQEVIIGAKLRLWTPLLNLLLRQHLYRFIIPIGVFTVRDSNGLDRVRRK